MAQQLSLSVKKCSIQDCFQPVGKELLTGRCLWMIMPTGVLCFSCQHLVMTALVCMYYSYGLE